MQLNEHTKESQNESALEEALEAEVQDLDNQSGLGTFGLDKLKGLSLDL